MYTLTVIDPERGDRQQAVETPQELADALEALDWRSVLRVIVVRVE